MAHPAAIESRFLERADRQRAWGSGLLVVAGLLWLYVLFELFTPWHTDLGHHSCSAPFHRNGGDLYQEPDSDSYLASDRHDAATACAAERDWPKPVAALAVSMPLALVGTALTVTSRTGIRVHALEAELVRAREQQRAS